MNLLYDIASVNATHTLYFSSQTITHSHAQHSLALMDERTRQFLCIYECAEGDVQYERWSMYPWKNREEKMSTY